MMRVWAYVNEKGVLCCAVLPEAVPQGVQAIELEVDSPEDVVLDNGKIRIRTEAEKLEMRKRQLLQELKSVVYSLLTPTDYVIIKLMEATINELDTEELMRKYKSVLDNRNSIRQWNEAMKTKIRDANNLDDLNRIAEEIRKRSEEVM